MGICPLCRTVLLSTKEAATRKNLTAARIRDILSAHPERMQAGRVGNTWLVLGAGVEGFVPQPNGVHLGNLDDKTWRPGICPQCGAQLLSPRQAAGELGVSTSRVYALLAKHPHRLWAFQVGSRWIIPQAGVEAYRRWKDALTRIQQAATAAPPTSTMLLVAAGASDPQKPELQVKLTFGPEVCRCTAVKTKSGKTFPHRPGGGDCPHKPRVAAGTVIAEFIGPAQLPNLEVE